MALLTPKTHPDHHTVGRHFIGPCFSCEAGKHVFYCESYDPDCGYWMTRADTPPEHLADVSGEWRRNVSERAIGRTYHEIHDDGPEFGPPWSRWGAHERADLIIPAFPEYADQPAR